ncbi:hypothetical protein [Anabaena sp. UHCC 0399]|uniref:hypothetical protein n=1 Tax=Anabaena sp. UHCC 0399 TaxID=3110238 RepID=UPI002B209291|nr:hypothetical protein [Anabaena sp. UHCC 0399]MEA5564280.1 hypothetical protein [Anabaena sp. UHCC 0399]
MFTTSNHLNRVVNIALFTLLLTTNFMVGKVNAKRKLDINLLVSSKSVDNTTEKISNNSLLKKIPGALNSNFITQNSSQDPIRVIPNPNDINILDRIKPFQNPDSDYDENDKIEPNTLDDQDINTKLPKNDLELLILNALSNSVFKYPWIIDPRDDFTFYSSTFNPLENSKYIDFSIKFSSEDAIFNRFTFADFPQKDQFYWVLPGNRVVVETKGWQSGVLYQGESSNTEIRQTIRLTQKLWGMQTVFSLPESLQELTEGIGINQFSIESIAAEVNNPVGVPAAPIIINSRSNQNNSISSLVPNISSFNADKDPLILQTFPTSNLQPLLGEVSLSRGSVIPQDTLENAGFIWGNPLTRERSQFQPPITSAPGIKFGNREQFDNSDLYNILLNPSITDNQRNLYYLNSLYWVSLSERQNNRGIREKTENNDWHRFYFSYSQNRTLLEYDPLEAKATYTNISTNPGISLSLSFGEREIDELQTANSTLGMLMGGIFGLIDFPHLTQSLQEAQERFSRQENFANLDSKATPEQRREINQRLNRSLFLGNRTSGLEQVSGKLTFPSTITPNSSNILQIRTGNHRRLVQFLDGKRTWREGETFISKAEVSNNSFGSLTSVNAPIPSQGTSNRSSALQVTLTDPNGQQFSQSLSSSDMTSLPIDLRLFDIAFDRIELSQDGQIMTDLQAFSGYLYLPTIEILLTGSSSKWNYSVNSGMWFNLNADTTFNVTNNFGFLEPTMGIYANGALNYINTSVEVDVEGKTQAITNHIPSLQFYWNSAANFQNPNYLNLSYFFSRQDRNLNYSLSTGVILLNDESSFIPSGFFQGKLVLNTGLEFSTSVEIRDQFFYTLEGIKQINPQWSSGVYLQNFVSLERGIRNRVNDFSYGLIIQHNTPSSSMFWKSRIGMSGDIFEARFEGDFRF